MELEVTVNIEGEINRKNQLDSSLCEIIVIVWRIDKIVYFIFC